MFVLKKRENRDLLHYNTVFIQNQVPLEHVAAAPSFLWVSARLSLVIRWGPASSTDRQLPSANHGPARSAARTFSRPPPLAAKRRTASPPTQEYAENHRGERGVWADHDKHWPPGGTRKQKWLSAVLENKSGSQINPSVIWGSWGFYYYCINLFKNIIKG